MIALADLGDLIARLARIDFATIQHVALEAAASQLEAAVKQELSHLPGADHATPWLRTGELRDSIAHIADEQSACVGSDDPAAVYQELGTRSDPPRPFLAPAAAAAAEDIAHAVAAAVARAIAGA